MSKFFLKLILMCLITTYAFSDIGNDFFQKAEVLYKMGEKEAANKWYCKSALFGDKDAYFTLAYRYVVTKEESVHYFTEAAIRGNEEALGYALDKLLFSAQNLKIANPKKALEVYETAKKINPNIRLYDEKSKVATIKKCAEPNTFNVDDFIKKYKLDEEIKEKEESYSSADFYYIWEYAEEASEGDGHFGDKNPELALNLICRGSSVPAELEIAVKIAYDIWKNDTNQTFSVCGAVMSGNGIGYCNNKNNK